MRSGGVIGDARIQVVLDRLHALADTQRKEAPRQHVPERTEAERKQFLSARFVALEREKSEFCYLLCRSMNARNIVEAGTSFGVSTIYLAAAVRDNGGGTVIATEYEPEKAAKARTHFAEAGVKQFIELRDGDLRETLQTIEESIDFALVDIWTPMAKPALELIAPHMRRGAVALCDNVSAFADGYREYLDYVADPANGFRSTILPFAGGLQMAVKV